jgi:hypothetical protein
MAEPALYERLGGIFAIDIMQAVHGRATVVMGDKYTLTVSDVLVIPAGVPQPVRGRHRPVPLPQCISIQAALAMTNAAAPDLFRIASKPTVNEAAT